MTQGTEDKKDYDLLKKKAQTATIRGRIVEKADKFTTVETNTSLFTIPNEFVLGITPVEGAKEVSDVQIPLDAKILHKATLTPAQVIGALTQVVFRPIFDCVNVLCEQCCTQCCEQCCTQCASVDPFTPVYDPSVSLTGVVAAFRRVAGGARRRG